MAEKLVSGMPYEAILAASPNGCVRCGSMVKEDPELEKIASNFPSGHELHGMIPYVCQHISCGKVMYGPPRLIKAKKDAPLSTKGCCF